MEETDFPYRLHKYDKRLTCTYCNVDGAVIGSKPLVANNEWNGEKREGYTLLHKIFNVYTYMDDNGKFAKSFKTTTTKPF
jgi:hypothetical protein